MKTRAWESTKLGARAMAMSLVALFIAGCPAQPQLSVSPLAVLVPADKTASVFQIANIGGGTLNWTASENLSWLSLAPAAGNAAKQAGNSLSGTLTTGLAGVQVIVDRAGQPHGNLSGEVQVTSNAGTQTVRVSTLVGGAATLRVTETSIDFGTARTELPLTINNDGDEELTWSVEVSDDAPWLTAKPVAGSLTDSTQSNIVTLSAKRGILITGTYTGTVTVKSNGGNIDVPVSMVVPPFSVSPAELNFGTVFTQQVLPISLTNKDADQRTLTLDAAVNNGGGWLALELPSLTLAGKQTASVNLTATATGLSPGAYTGVVTVSGAGFQVVVPVSMTVSSFIVSPPTITYGRISTTQQTSFTLQNLGSAAVSWNATYPGAAEPWLDLSTKQGTVNPGNTQTVDVTISPQALAAGTYDATLTISHDGQTDTILIHFERPLPASLSVAPSTINFGTVKNEELIGIWNPGEGTVNWSIDTTGFPNWLSLEPTNGGVASGTVSGEITDSVIVRVDRTVTPLGVTDFAHTFNVVATGDVNQSIPVNVSMKVPLIPRIVVDSPTDDNGVNYISVPEDEVSGTIVIRNEGNGLLTWNFDPSNQPAWVASISPAQANLAPGTEKAITITVDRSTLTYLGAQITMQILSNDPARPAVPLIIQVLVPKRVAIGTRPDAFAFGTTQTTDLLEVANIGDPDTVMLFKLTPSIAWLDAYPRTGSSIGTASAIKDFQPFTITVDRSRLDANGAAGTIKIEAVDTDGAVIADVAPVEVSITVQAAELTLETTPLPAQRPPSVVRLPMILRNIRYQSIGITQGVLPILESNFQILENDVPIETTETGLQVKKGFASRTAFATNLLIMLDYSGSMFASAASVADAAIAGAPDPLQALYNQTISKMIDAIPAGTAIGLAIFSDRDPQENLPLNYIFGTAGEPLAQQDEIFIADRTALKNRLNSIVVNDHGATQLLTAVEQAVQTVRTFDLDRNQYIADLSDFPAIVCVTDGRITTPPTPVASTATVLQDARIRFYPIGWGQGVASAPLVLLAGGSGGHYYSTQTDSTGIFDPLGNEIRQPRVSELDDWCENEADPCDQSIGKDFDSMITLSYVSLDEETGAVVKARITFDDQSDTELGCIPEQGNISGSVTEQPADFASYASDNRLGQISMRTLGADANLGTAQVVVRLEYAPRNVSSLTVQLGVDNADALAAGAVKLVTEPNDGVISDWTIQNLGGGAFKFTSTGNPLPFGEFGDLFTVDLTGVQADAQLFLDVTDPVITGNPESKYFCYPDAIAVNLGAPSLAPALPTPEVTTNPPFEFGKTRTFNNLQGNGNDPAFNDVNQRVIDLGTNVSSFTYTIRNVGGSHFVDQVRLNYEVGALGAEASAISFDPNDQLDGYIYSTQSSVTLHPKVSRTIAPGNYQDSSIGLDFNYGGIGLGSSMPPLLIKWTVLPSILSVTPTDLDFGNATNVLPLTISNVGQSSAFWQVLDVTSFPDWLSMDRYSGLITDTPDTPSVVVDRAGLAPGPQTYSFEIQNALVPSQIITVNITMNVP